MTARFASALAVLLPLAAAPVIAQDLRPVVPDAAYARAELLLPWNTSRILPGDPVSPNWYPDGNRFWYRNTTQTGAEFVTVDPARNTRERLFDHARLAASISVALDSAVDPEKLPFRSFDFGDDGDNERVIEFRHGKKQLSCDINTYACTAGDTTYTKTTFVRSPDKQWEAFVIKHDVYVRPTGESDTTKHVRLTTDGEENWSYGLRSARPMELFRPQPRRPQIRWSPDSRLMLVARTDERKVAHMHYVSSTSQRPKHFSQPYALPGDSIIPVPGYHLIARDGSRNVPVDFNGTKHSMVSGNGSLRDSVWTPDSKAVKLGGMARGSKAQYLYLADAETGKARLVARDTGKTYVESSNPRDPDSWYVLANGDALWWSERDGWGHLYLMRDNAVVRQITSGPWQVGAVMHVDERTRQVYFTARGREAGRFVYHAHLYKAGLDGGAVALVTPEDANHDVSVSPGGRFFVDRISTVATAPKTLLRDLATGRVIRQLEEADVTQLLAIGWRPAQPFTTKARDGITDIHGVLYLPAKVDSGRKYPVISNIYPGPQVGSVGAWNFKSGGEPYALAALGFAVVQIDHMGTPLRSKAFHDNYYANFGDNGIADHVAAIKQLGAQHSFLDLDRVGIYGHSGGGFASTGAMFRFPDFFKVAVSGAGNHDNRSYNIYWAEKYQGLLTKDTMQRGRDNFTDAANQTHAANLRGKLLLMHGDMDDNVHPAMTIQVVDALIKANKTFDLVIAPNRAHSLNEPYFLRRRWDYFVEHLLGAVPPRDYQIAQPRDGDAMGRMGGGTTAAFPVRNDYWIDEAIDWEEHWLSGRGGR